MPIKQAGRFLTVKTPLGEDALILTEMSGKESMSSLFSYQLEMLSDDHGIAAKDIVGKKVTFTVHGGGTSPRFFNGYCSRFYAGGRRSTPEGDVRVYRAEISPWLWFLTRTQDCRIYQEKTAQEILEEVFKDNGFSDFKFEIRRELPKYNYKVQYRETDFGFISRLMEDEGIFYFFKHEDDLHTMVIADKKESYYDVEENAVDVGGRASRYAAIERFSNGYEFLPGKWVQRDYDFEKPSDELKCEEQTTLEISDFKKYEMYDYPGCYKHKGTTEENGGGTDYTKIRMEEEEAIYHIAEGSGRCASFSPGGKFTVEQHEIESEAGKNYAITQVIHSGTDYSIVSSNAAPPEYSNSFACMPSDVVYRPSRMTTKPTVEGPQTAVVVGPSGEEIECDEYGRIKVQFHWDRYGKKDDKSSCWIRVAQLMAGKTWGGIFIPRMGMEVIVSFLEGDPDQPLVTGCVYNQEYMPPYELPGNKTQSGFKSLSSKEGGLTTNNNELRFEDKKDSEEIYFHAEKDMNRVVENNDTLKVGFEKMEDGDQTIEIYHNQDLTVGNNQTVKVGYELADPGDQALEVCNDRTTTIGNNDELTVEQGDLTTTVSTGDRTTNVSAGKDVLEAAQSIELICGGSSIKLEPAKITIKSVAIEIKGDATLDAKSAMTTVKGDGTLTLKGAMTMIN